MRTLIISGESKKDIQFLASIAEKMGLDVKFITEDDLEDFGIAKAMDQGKTGEFIDTDEFLNTL